MSTGITYSRALLSAPVWRAVKLDGCGNGVVGDRTSPTRPTTAWIKQEISSMKSASLFFENPSPVRSHSDFRYSSFGLFLLPFGLPRRFTSASHLGGLPRLFPCPIVRRSSTTIASEICSRSVRRSASILLMSIFPAYLDSGAAVTNLFWLLKKAKGHPTPFGRGSVSGCEPGAPILSRDQRKRSGGERRPVFVPSRPA
jgi:hypothetical protein